MKIACHVTQIAKSVLQADNPQDIDAYEYELATSPCLSSLLARVTRYNFYKKADYNGDAVIELANGLAPNLTNEHLFFESPGLSRLNSITASRPPWRGFFRNRSNCDGSSFKGHLRELSLNLPVAKTGFFGTWKDQNAFAELLGLHLWRQSVSTLTLDLATKISSCKFPVLESPILDFGFTRDEEFVGFSMKRGVYLSHIFRLCRAYVSPAASGRKYFKHAVQAWQISAQTFPHIRRADNKYENPRHDRLACADSRCQPQHTGTALYYVHDNR
ncbi:hypothetical protein N7444_008304 [Penicillium canescens]|nr:hypothetical protein N7444_008304 [Penicillium canescens]